MGDSIYTMDYPYFTVSNFLEKSTGLQRVNMEIEQPVWLEIRSSYNSVTHHKLLSEPL